VPLTELSTPELIRDLAAGSAACRRQVGALVHRSGAVDYVVVGDANRIMLPDVGRLRAAEGRFRGLRLVHTHVGGEALSKDDVVDLVRLRLDLVAVLHLTPVGDVRAISYAHNVPTAGVDDALPYRIIGPLAPSAVQLDVGRLMSDLEAEFAKLARTRTVQARDGRALLVHVASNADERTRGRGGVRAEGVASLRELRELARTAGVAVVDEVLQVRDRLDAKFVLGKGKLEDVILRAIDLDAQVLVFDHNLTAAQAASIAKVSDLRVIDRSQLILDIFAQRAESRDGKLQVELAQLKYSLPRLAQKDDSLSRLSGGIGGRGPGETKLEIGRRRAKDRVNHLEDQLAELAKQRTGRRRRRTRGGVPTVAIVGYTNAGKSTLLNSLTGANVLVEDKLFATLDTRSRVLKVGWAGWGEREIVVTDTVGFIRNLPKDLFAAFRATFEEAEDADLLVHVVDASDAAAAHHIETTENVLAELELDELPRLLVWNKLDLAEPEVAARLRRQYGDACTVSATNRESLRPLLVRIAELLAERWSSAARGPELTPPADGESACDAQNEVDAGDPGTSASTLDELLARAGRRVRRNAQAESSR
jgi:GTPase